MNKKINSIEENLKNFIKNIDSLQTSLHLTMKLLLVSHKVNYNKLVDFLKNKTKKRNSKKPTIKCGDIPYYEKLTREIDITETSFKVVPRSTLISLISQFDAFMGSIIKIVLLRYPEILNECESNITYSSLSDFKNVNEIKNYIIEKKIASILRENHTYHFEWLEEKLKIPLRDGLSIWPTFIELTERRNLFTHCGGEISSQYITVCKKNNVPLDKKYKLGYELEVPPQYLDSAYKCLYELGVKLTHVIWRKLKLDDLDTADESLNNICYNLINRKSYSLADILLEFATNTLKKHTNKSILNCLIINKALSKKLNGNKKEAHKIINNEDWSASSNDFKLGKEVILDNNEKVFLLMKKIGKTSKFVDKASYRNWPLFREMKKNKKFQKTFKGIYKEEYELKENRLEYNIKLTVKPKKKKKPATKKVVKKIRKKKKP